MISKLQNTVCIAVCSFSIMSNAMSFEQGAEAERKDSEVRALAKSIGQKVNEEFYQKLGVTSQKIRTAIKNELHDYLLKHSYKDEAEQIAARARGMYVYKWRKMDPQVLDLPHEKIEGIWVETHDAEPATIYVAGGKSGTVSIVQEQEAAWVCTGTIAIAGKPFVRFAREVPHASSGICEPDRIAIETGETRRVSELHVYGKVHYMAGGYEWKKQDYKIAMNSRIKAYAFSPNAWRCAVITGGLRQDQLTCFERAGKSCRELDRVNIDPGAGHIVWKDQATFLLTYFGRYQEGKVDGRGLIKLRSIEDKREVKNLIIENVLGWKVSHQGGSKITIDNGIAAIARYMQEESLNRSRNNNNQHVELDQEGVQKPEARSSNLTAGESSLEEEENHIGMTLRMSGAFDEES